MEEIEGPLRRNQATLLIPKKRFVDALWILNALTDAEQKSAQTYVVKARIAEARKRYKTALRYWRRATKAKDALPSVHRDYGRYLAERKRWRTAARALKRYLKLAPDALDAPDIINELEQLKRKKR